MTIKQDLTKDVVPSPYVELFIIDGTNIDPSLFFNFTPSSDYPIGFGSYGTFTPFPIAGSGWEATSAQPPRPKLTVSNVTKVVQPFVQQFKDLTQVKVTRIRTLAKYLDDGSNPDDTQMFPPEVYFINTLSSHNKHALTFELVSAVDLQNVKFPLGQALKDDTGAPANLYAPGLSSRRFRG